MRAFTAGPMGSLAGVHAPGDGSMRDIDRDGGGGFLALLEERAGRLTDSDREAAADAGEARSGERVPAGSGASGSRGVEDEETGVGGRVRRALAQVKESAEDAMKQGARAAAGAGSDEGAGPAEAKAPAMHGMAGGGEPLMAHGKLLSPEAHASGGASAGGGAGTGALGVLGELGEGAEAAAAHAEEQEQGPEGTGGEQRRRLRRRDGSGIEAERVERAASGQAQGAGELKAGERGTDSLHANGAGVAADRDRTERAEAGERGSGVSERGARGEARAGESKLVVVDLRSERQRREAATDRNRTAEARRVDSVRDQAVRRGLETELDARVVVKSAGGEAREGSPAESPRGAAHEVRTPVPSRFQQELRSEVVRHSTMILRNDGQGELRLILKPESLGQVRIRLSMNNNRIEGRIIVENSTVKDMFDSNLAHLSQAFEKEGFSSASLEVAVGHKGERREGRQEGPAGSVHHEEEFDKNLAALDDPARETRLVNITV